MCLEIPTEPCTIDCGNEHIYCKPCILQWSKLKLECPYCKAPYTSYKVFGSNQSVLFDEPVTTAEAEAEADYDEEEEERDYDGGVNDEDEDLIRGYESDEGFIVDDDAVEYDSEIEERGDLRFKEGTIILESSDEDEFVESDDAESDLDDTLDQHRRRDRKRKKKKRKRRRDEEKSEKSQRVDDDEEEEEQEEVDKEGALSNSSTDYASFFDQFAYKD